MDQDRNYGKSYNGYSNSNSNSNGSDRGNNGYYNKNRNERSYYDRNDRGANNGRNDRNNNNREKRHNYDEEITENYNYVNLTNNLIEENGVLYSKEVKEQECLKFDDMNSANGGLKDNLMRGIISFGFDIPSKIQGLTIPQIIQGKDILAQAQSGTGKTGAFMIGALQNINDELNSAQVIILSPTRELALQTETVGKELSKFMNNIKFTLTVGQTNKDKNVEDMKKGSQILIATPGRIIDLISSNGKLFEHVKMIILDECDELLKNSFQNDIYTIIQSLNPNIQLCLFSATLTKTVVEIVSVVRPNSLYILIQKEKISLDGIQQTFIAVNYRTEKIGLLKEMLANIPIQQFIVYVNSKDASDNIKYELERDDIQILTINSSNTQEERIDTIKKFKKGDAKCLISTDLLSRGLDVQQLSLVVNYELPKKDNIESYIHRIGRTGRFGKKGLTINFVTEEERRTQNLISTTFKCNITQITKNNLAETFNNFF